MKEQEYKDAVAALHRWFESQGIPSAQRAVVCAIYCVNDIVARAKDKSTRKDGLERLVFGMMQTLNEAP